MDASESLSSQNRKWAGQHTDSSTGPETGVGDTGLCYIAGGVEAVVLYRLRQREVSLNLRGLWTQLRESGAATAGCSNPLCFAYNEAFHAHVANSYTSVKAGPEYPYWSHEALD